MNFDLIVWGSDLSQVMQRYLAFPLPSTILPTNITPPNKGVVLGSTILLHPKHWPQNATNHKCNIEIKHFRQVETDTWSAYQLTLTR